MKINTLIYLFGKYLYYGNRGWETVKTHGIETESYNWY